MEGTAEGAVPGRGPAGSAGRGQDRPPALPGRRDRGRQL